MGTPEYASTILAALLAYPEINVVGVYTRPDRPVGRKQILTPPDVKRYVLENAPHLPIFQPNSLRGDDVVSEIVGLKPDFIVVAAYGQILPKSVLEIAPCINLHASLLPKYRGASPIQSAIMAGEKETGVTSMLMDVGLDTGDILLMDKTSCYDKMSAELFDELADMAARLSVRTLLEFNQITPQKQDDSKASECRKIKKELGLTSFSESARSVYDKYRALTPWPGIFLQSGLKILELDFVSDTGASAKEAEIIFIDKNGFDVGFGGGVLRVKKVQEAGKKPVLARDYINGKRLEVGSKIY